MKNSIKKIVLSSLLAAVVCVATMIIKLPSPFKGYMNIGDCAVLLCAYMLPVPYGALAAAIGSALADLFSGYVMYAPATFVIKGIMVLAFYLIRRLIAQRLAKDVSILISGLVAELVMISGYFLFEGVLYGFAAALVNIPLNSLQGAVGLVLGALLIRLISRSKLIISKKDK